MGQEMVGQQDRLGPLQVRIPGQVGPAGLLGPLSSTSWKPSTSPARAINSRLA